MLAKRLVDQLSASEDYEISMIIKLKVSNIFFFRTNSLSSIFKEACGLGYTSKLQQMLQDIDISKNLNNLYQAYCKKEQLTNISVLLINRFLPF